MGDGNGDAPEDPEPADGADGDADGAPETDGPPGGDAVPEGGDDTERSADGADEGRTDGETPDDEGETDEASGGDGSGPEDGTDADAERPADGPGAPAPDHGGPHYGAVGSPAPDAPGYKYRPPAARAEEGDLPPEHPYADDPHAPYDDPAADPAVHEPGTVDDGSGGGSVDWSVSEPTPEADGGTASAPVTGGTGRGRGTAGSVLDAPETDEERPLTEHIEELVRRLAAVILVVVGATAVGVPFAEPVIDFLWYSFLPAGEAPRVYGPLELVLTKLKVAGLAGVVVGLPALVYEAYLFMRPGLYAHERRYYLASVPTSLLLALVGIAFAHLIVLPTVFAYFTGYTQDAATVAFGLGETFNLIVILMAYFAFVFQIPLFVMLAIMMGVTDRAWLEDRRVYFWGGFLGLAFVFTPDPTGMAPVVVAATMIGLFEGTLLLLRWTDRGAFAPDSIAAHRPYAWGLAAVVGYAAGPWPVPSGYHGALPTALTRTLADLGIGGAAPALIAGGAIAVFEGLAAAGRRTESLRLRLAFLRARPAAWITAVVVGYLATPSPLPLRVADSVTLPVPLAVAVVAGLIAAFETGLIALRRRRG